MAIAKTPSKTDLQDQIDRATEALDEAYTPESTREELASSIGHALDILRGEDEDLDEEDEDLDEDDEDSLG